MSRHARRRYFGLTRRRRMALSVNAPKLRDAIPAAVSGMVHPFPVKGRFAGCEGVPRVVVVVGPPAIETPGAAVDVDAAAAVVVGAEVGELVAGNVEVDTVVGVVVAPRIVVEVVAACVVDVAATVVEVVELCVVVGVVVLVGAVVLDATLVVVVTAAVVEVVAPKVVVVAAGNVVVVLVFATLVDVAPIVVVVAPHVTESLSWTCWGPSNFHVTSTSTFAVAPNSNAVSAPISTCAVVVALVTSTSSVMSGCASTCTEICTMTPASGNPENDTVTSVQLAVMPVTV